MDKESTDGLALTKHHAKQENRGGGKRRWTKPKAVSEAIAAFVRLALCAERGKVTRN